LHKYRREIKNNYGHIHYIQTIKKWKLLTLPCDKTRKQSPKQPAAILKGSPQTQKAVCGCINSLYLTEISWQAVAVSQLQGNREHYTFGNLTEKKVILLSWKKPLPLPQMTKISWSYLQHLTR